MTRFQISRGKSAGEGLGIGLLAGMPVGGAFWAIYCSAEPPGESGYCGAYATGAFYAAAITGSIMVGTRERWQTIRGPAPRLAVGIAPQRNGVSASLTLRF